MQLCLTYPTQSWPETWYMVYNLKKNKKQKTNCNLFHLYLLQMYKKKSSIKCCWWQQNLEKYTFGLPQKSNTYCTVKVYKIGAKHCCNVTIPVLKSSVTTGRERTADAITLSQQYTDCQSTQSDHPEPRLSAHLMCPVIRKPWFSVKKAECLQHFRLQVTVC